MEFDLSLFAEIGRWIFNTAMQVFSMFTFNFGDFEINGLAFIIGITIFGIVCLFLGWAAHNND